MKKENIKKQFDEMLEGAQDVYEFTQYGEKVTEHQMKSGTFRASFVSVKDNEESRRLAEEYIRKRAAEVNRKRSTPRSVVERRSNQFQQGLAFINEHRHLIPFFRFVYEYLQKHPTKSDTDAVKEWKKKHKSLPAEVTFKSYWYDPQGGYTLGDKMPSIGTVAYQIPVLPKAWML